MCDAKAYSYDMCDAQAYSYDMCDAQAYSYDMSDAQAYSYDTCNVLCCLVPAMDISICPKQKIKPASYMVYYMALSMHEDN